MVLFPRTLGGLTHHSCEHKGRTCGGQIPTATPTRRDFLRQQFFLLPPMWTSGLYPCQRKMNSSQQCYDSHLSHIKRWTARFCLNSHFLVAFSYLSRIQIVLILFSFHVPDTSQAHACQNPEGRRLQMKEGKRTWHWGMVPSMSKGVGKGTASQSHRRSHLNSTSGLSSVAGPRTNLGHTGPTLGLFQSSFSRILLLSLKPSPPTSKILKATSLEFLLSSIHKVSNICWHQLCARNSAEHGISAVILQRCPCLLGPQASDN